jgi:hypothetical protein
MANAIETAVRTYAAAFTEPDHAARAKMLEACWAEDGQLVTRSRVIRGRAALAAEMDRLAADPRGLAPKFTTAIDAQGTTFRFRATTATRDGGTFGEVHDAGMVDADGRIALILTFAGPLVEV